MFKFVLPLLVATANALPTLCPPFEGGLTLNIENLYPESADWDLVHCRLYLSSAYNGTLVQYDPYAKTYKTFAVPGVTNTSTPDFQEYHLDGIDYDHRSGLIYTVASSATAFTSTDTGDYSKANFTGPNRVFRFDPASEEFISDISLQGVQQAYLNKTSHLTNGFQDMAENSRGDSFAIGTFGNSIARIPKGQNHAELWYAPKQYDETYGFGGIFSIGDKLIVSDTHIGGLVGFDSLSKRPQAYTIPITNKPSGYAPMADGLIAPSKYNGRIALWSDDFNGTAVYGSIDKWASAKYLGLVQHNSSATQGGFVVASFEAGSRIFSILEYFQLSLPVESKATFPVLDITDEVDVLARSL